MLDHRHNPRLRARKGSKLSWVGIMDMRYMIIKIIKAGDSI